MVVCVGEFCWDTLSTLATTYGGFSREIKPLCGHPRLHHLGKISWEEIKMRDMNRAGWRGGNVWAMAQSVVPRVTLFVFSPIRSEFGMDDNQDIDAKGYIRSIKVHCS